MKNKAPGNKVPKPTTTEPIYDKKPQALGAFADEEQKGLRHVEIGRTEQFGLPAYCSRYPVKVSSEESSSILMPRKHALPPERWCTAFDVILSPQFWRQAQYALRVTIFGVLLPASLIAANLPNSPFVSTTFTFTSVALGSRLTVGENMSYLFAWIRGACLWLPIATIGAAIHLDKSMPAWYVFYTVFLFVIALLTEDVTRRFSLLVFNFCMIGILVDPSYGAVYPSRVMADWTIGVGLSLLASLVPYPFFCKSDCQQALADISQKLGKAFTGVTSCFWAESNLERNMAISNVRMINLEIDNLLAKFHAQQEWSFFEFPFEAAKVRHTRSAKGELFESLRSNLRGLSRVLDIVETKPWVFDDSERSKRFGSVLQPRIKQLASSVENLTELLGKCTTFRQLKGKHSQFLEIYDCAVKLQHEFSAARRALFYEHHPYTMEEFYPLMAFFIFSLINFCDTLMKFNYDISESKVACRDSFKTIIMKGFYDHFKQNVGYFKELGRRWQRREIQRIIEAAKVSAAMTLSMGFSYLIGVDKKSLAGPGIIAYVSGANPVEAVQASIARLTACVLGTALGFFAGTYSTTNIEKVASLCVLFFVGLFFRYDKDYGIMAIYSLVVLIPLNTLAVTTIDDTIQRMNQITFGIFIYLFISILVFPLSPSFILRKKRINILHMMSKALDQITALFSEPLPIGNIHSNSTTNARSEPDPIDDIFGNASLAIRSFGVYNKYTTYIARRDQSMEAIEAQLRELERRNKATYPFMGFSREERGLIDIGYPVKACEKTSFHLYRMICLLRTMWSSWDVIRSQRFYSPEIHNVLQVLQPIACDVSRFFSRFVDSICAELCEPQNSHKSELVQVILEFVQAVEELDLRKNYIMVNIVNNSVRAHRHKRGDSAVGLGPDAFTHSTAGQEPEVDQPEDFKTRTGKKTEGASVLTLLRKGTKGSLLDETSSSMAESVLLNESFILPLSGEDIECLHSFALSIQMFADETRQLFMSLDEMLDHLRKHI